MTSIIEQAAKRLEELNRAGYGAPGLAVEPVPGRAPANDSLPLPEAAVARQPLHPAPTSAPRGVDPYEQLEPQVMLDLERLASLGYMVPSDTRALVAEEFRLIKRPLLKNARSKDAIAGRLPLIMVTSALPGEGKTYSAINLALSIATEIDMSVLLVDADVVRPEAMRRLGVTEPRGLLDLLTDESRDLRELVLRTNVPKLSVLPAGSRNHLSTELLASSAMDRLLQRLANESPRQIVVFDAPPLLVTNEAKVLASRVGQIVVVVEAERTARAAVAQAFATLEQCPVVMSVLNKASPRASAVATGYGYGYGYGY